MHLDISHVVVVEHRRRLREAAQAPSNRLIARAWATLRRRPQTPPPAIAVPAHELERLAA